ncbi:antibiotic biosynthesis monooxygenase [Actinomycetospora chlora]|uniref:Antibiotic biosynthesis monooxygenase n=1 Tax=Actinomycetospora chlora TaxID=663608 RepID=A0ABP9AHQ7_9PSEU
MPTSTIAAGTTVTTLINHFTVAPERQAELVALLEEATEEVIRHVPGFVSANLHASLDGTHVVNYAQWESQEALEGMWADPAAREHMAAATAIATAEPRMYRVASVHHV